MADNGNGNLRTWIGRTTGTVYREADNPPFMTMDHNPISGRRYRRAWDELSLHGKQRRVDDFDLAVSTSWVGRTTGTVYREADNPPFMTMYRNPISRCMYKKPWDELSPKRKQKRVDDFDLAVAQGVIPFPVG